MPLKLQRLCAGLVIITSIMLAGGCTVQEGIAKKSFSAVGLIATPASHYSTQKARYLGAKYKENIDRLIERIIGNPKTAKLQFANNIGSSGGMGFFTHSAVKSPDDRFLEVVLGTGENLEAKGEYSIKVARLFSLYGRELLVILAGDPEIYNDRELSGYGLNFTWRSLASRMNTERAIVYFPKEKVRAFLKEEIGENTLLADAVIFVSEQEGQANLMSFRALEPAPDVRAPIQEQVLAPGIAKEKPNDNPVMAKGKAKSTDGIKPRQIAEESSAWEKKNETRAAQNEAISKLVSPNGIVLGTEEIVPQRNVAPLDGEKTHPVSSGSAMPQSDKIAMPSTEVTTTMQPARLGLESPQPEIETKAVQSTLQLKTKELKTSQPGSSVEQPKEKEQNELRSDPAGSQLRVPVGPSPASEVSKSDLGVPQAPALAPIKIPSSSPKDSKPSRQVDKLGELASLPKVDPKRANLEPPVPAPSTLQDAGADAVELEPIVAHDKRIETIPEIKSLPKPMPKVLEGYIIQVPFEDRSIARRWADTFEQRGYAVSITEAGRVEPVRVRIGNFRQRDDAERQLKSIREDGLIGIILNLPQVYRREVRTSLP